MPVRAPRRRPLARLVLATVATAGIAAPAAADLELDLDEGARGWQVVLDGVMGGLSTGRTSAPEPGVLRFTGTLSLENNGGFSQIRRAIDAGALDGADGIELRVRGDGRRYAFDLRSSQVRMMASSWNADFQPADGTWSTIRLPFSDFVLTSFGNRVRNAPRLDPARIEGLGVTLGDKRTGPFALEIDFIRGYRDGEPMRESGDGAVGGDAPSGTGPSLAEVAGAAGLDTLLQLVAASGLALPDEPVTVLAPTDDAFAALPAETVRFLTSDEGRPTLRTILAHHVVPGRLPASALLERRGTTSLAGQRLAIDFDGRLSVGGAAVVAADVAFDGGLVHVIDAVIDCETRTVAEVLAEDERLSTLAAAVDAAGLTTQLGPRNDGPWTLLAPTNAAFAALPEGAVAALLEPARRTELVQLLAGHVVPARLARADLAATERARTLASSPVTFDVTDGSLRVNGARLVVTDVPAANGVIHLIDAVLLPAEDATDASADGRDATGEFPEALRLIDDAVAVGAPLFNDGNTVACYAVYRTTLVALLELGADRLGGANARRLRSALDAAARERDAAEAAWTLRRAIDAVYGDLLGRAGRASRTGR